MVRGFPKVTQIVRGKAQVPAQMWLRYDVVSAEHRVMQSRVLWCLGTEASLRRRAGPELVTVRAKVFQPLKTSRGKPSIPWDPPKSRSGFILNGTESHGGF